MSVLVRITICLLAIMSVGTPLTLAHAERPVGFAGVGWSTPRPLVQYLAVGWGQISPPQDLIPNLKVVWYLSNGTNLILITHGGNYTIKVLGHQIVLLTVDSVDSRTNSTGWATLRYTSTTGCWDNYLLGADMYNRINHPESVFLC